MTPTPVPSPDGPSAEVALAAWMASTFEPVALGVLHSLSNRMCALESLTALPADARTVQFGKSTDTHIQVEVSQAIDLQRILRGLFPGTTSPEALDLRDVATEAAQLAEHHPVVRRSRSSIRVTGDSAATRAPRWMLRRVMVTMLSLCAKPGAVTLAIVAGDAEHEVCVRSGTGPDDAPATGGIGYAEALARACGGRLDREPNGYRFCMPSLAELRRRERPSG